MSCLIWLEHFTSWQMIYCFAPLINLWEQWCMKITLAVNGKPSSSLCLCFVFHNLVYGLWFILPTWSLDSIPRSCLSAFWKVAQIRPISRSWSEFASCICTSRSNLPFCWSPNGNLEPPGLELFTTHYILEHTTCMMVHVWCV